LTFGRLDDEGSTAELIIRLPRRRHRPRRPRRPVPPGTPDRRRAGGCRWGQNRKDAPLEREKAQAG